MSSLSAGLASPSLKHEMGAVKAPVKKATWGAGREGRREEGAYF